MNIDIIIYWQAVQHTQVSQMYKLNYWEKNDFSKQCRSTHNQRCCLRVGITEVDMENCSSEKIIRDLNKHRLILLAQSGIYVCYTNIVQYQHNQGSTYVIQTSFNISTIRDLRMLNKHRSILAQSQTTIRDLCMLNKHSILVQSQISFNISTIRDLRMLNIRNNQTSLKISNYVPTCSHHTSQKELKTFFQPEPPIKVQRRNDRLQCIQSIE